MTMHDIPTVATVLDLDHWNISVQLFASMPCVRATIDIDNQVSDSHRATGLRHFSTIKSGLEVWGFHCYREIHGMSVRSKYPTVKQPGVWLFWDAASIGMFSDRSVAFVAEVMTTVQAWANPLLIAQFPLDK